MQGKASNQASNARVESTLEVSGLSKTFSGHVAVRGVSFTADRGEILGLVGANGSGKTTLLNLLSGFALPDGPVAAEPNCVIRLAGSSLVALSPWRRSRLGVGRSFQGIRLPSELSVREVLQLPGRAGWESALPDLGGIPSDNTSVAQLSYGQRKSLSVVAALRQGSRLALLDEPFAGLSSQARDKLGEAIVQAARAGSLILLAEHNLAALLKFCTRLLVLTHGALAIDEQLPTPEIEELVASVVAADSREEIERDAPNS